MEQPEQIYSDQAVARWTEFLQRELAERRDMNGRWLMAGLRLLVISLAFLILMKGRYLYCVYGAWGGLFAGRALAGRSEKRQKAASALARSSDPRAVSALAIACLRDRQVDMIASAGVKRMLPMLQAADAEAITTEGMAALIALLQSPDPALVLAILKALEQVGDNRATLPVRALTTQGVRIGKRRLRVRYRWFAPSISSAWEDVRTAAVGCLAELQNRADLDRQRALLLRAAEADPAALLRAATVTGTPPQQLLRSASDLHPGS